DACFQAVGAHPVLRSDTTGTLMLPLGVRRLRAYASTRNAHYCYARIVSVTPAAVEVDLDLLDEDGAVLLAVGGLRVGTGVSDTGQRDRTFSDRLLTIEWRHQELPEVDYHDAGRWLLISTSDAADLLATKLADALKSHDVDVTTMVWPQHSDHDAHAARLREQLAAQQFGDVLVVTPPRHGVTDEQSGVRGGDNVRHLVKIVRELPETPGEAPRLHVLTRNAQTVLSDDSANLDEAGLRGLVRVIGTEFPQLKTAQIDVDDYTDAAQIAAQLVSGSDEDETAWRGSKWYVARLVPGPLRPEERRTTVVNPAREGMRLQIRTPGDIQSLELAAFERVAPGPGQIEVSVTASNLNFADVLVAFGKYPSFEGRMPKLGADFAGVVTAVGPGVTGHKVGDRVGGISADGAWATFVTCDANLAVTLPPGLPTNRAAAVPSAHATAWYSLHDLARVTAGDKVLIHSATGGVGQAAIAIARAAGADIYATAGSEARRELLRGMGIEHVYDSRSTAFADEIRRDTDGYGVDIVLNSLTGAAQKAGLELLSFGGRFVEIGKRDIYGDTRMGLFPFRRNLSFYAVDLALLSLTNPDTLRRLLEVCYQQIADGVLPLPETTHYPLEDGATAIRVMGAAEHTGKLVLDIPHGGQINAVVPPEEAQAVRRDGAYVVTGGLGGLGLFLAGKLADSGAGRIILNGRSVPSAAAKEAIERIRRAGTEVEVELGDIAEPDTAERLVVAACATGLPLRGVLHGGAEPAPGDRQADPGLVLRVLLGRRAGRLAGAGRLRRREQLAGRVHPLATQPESARHIDRLGPVVGNRRRRGVGREQRGRHRTGGRCLCVRDPAAARSGLQRLRARGRHPVAGRVRPDEQVRRGVPIVGAAQHRQRIPRRVARAAAGRVAGADAPDDRRADQPDPAPVGRPGPPARRVRSRFARHVGSTHPHRGGDRYSYRIDRYFHDQGARRSLVRCAGA
ncbi:MAG: polyketide synthase, partial [Mycobacterium sp.]|nr:polyketide synthase [Mycobacterium sp.]